MANIPKIMLGYQKAQLILTGTKIGLYDYLDGAPRPIAEIQTDLGLHPRMLFDYLDAMVSLGVLSRTGAKESAVYSIAEDSREYLVQGGPNWRAGQFHIHGGLFYNQWGTLDELIRTGQLQRPKTNEDENVYERLYQDPEQLVNVMNYMASIQSMEFPIFAKNYDFSTAKTLVDIGGASGALCIAVSKEQPHLQLISADLPSVQDFASNQIELAGSANRITAASIDFFKDDSFPSADIITFGNILHDWGADTKRMLMQKAFNALPAGGQLISIEQHIDNDRNEATEAMMMSLHMGIVTESGYNWSQADFEDMAKEVGFSEFKFMTLYETQAAIAIK